MRTLPDLLRPGLSLVFVGINPGERSARAGHYYAHPGNRFWSALADSPLVTGTVTAADDRSLADREGIGFTDVVKRVTSDSTSVSLVELRTSAPALARRIADAAPRAVCFTSTRAFDALFPGVRDPHQWGRQGASLGGGELWVMPSTSGRAVAYRDEVDRVLAGLATALDRCRSGEA